MKKLRFLILIAIILGSALPLTGVKAAEPDLLFGQSHDYSVVLRGNGEAIVYAKIQLTNSGDTAISTYEFEVPRMKPSEIVGYQVVLPQSCVRYDTTINSRNAPIEPDRPCLQYQAYDSSYGYIPDNSEFLKLKVVNEGGSKYSLQLPKAIEPDKTNFLILSYIGTGYVKKSMGVLSFNFETLKVPNRIKNTTVAVDVDSDFILEGKRSKVNYATPATTELSKGDSLAAGASASSLRAFSDSIGTDGALIKEAKNLSANETFTVKGRYAESAWRLNLGRMVVSLVVLAAVVTVLIWLLRRYRRKHAGGVRPQAATTTASTASTTPSTQNHPPLSLTNPAYILAGFVSAALVMAGTVGLSIYIKSSESNYNYDPDPMSVIIFSLLAIIFYVLSILGPAIWMASAKRDWRIFIYVIVWEFGWLLLFMLFYQFGYKGLIDDGSSVSPGQPIPLNDCLNC